MGLRFLAVVDDYTRECLPLVADTSISGTRVARELDKIITKRGQPGGIARRGGGTDPRRIRARHVDEPLRGRVQGQLVKGVSS